MDRRPVRTVGILSAVAVIVGACGGTADPQLVPATTTEPSSTTTQVPRPTETTVELTVADDDPTGAPRLLVATDDGVQIWADGQLTPLVGQGTVLQRAVDDGAGGAVGLSIDDQLLATMTWWPAVGDPIVLRSQGGLILHDSTTRADSAAVVITYSPVDSLEPVVVLDVLDLATTSSRTVAQVGDATSSAAAVAAAADFFAAITVDGQCAAIGVIDDFGEPGDGQFPEPICQEDAPGYGAIAVDDDGEHFIVTRQQTGVDGQAVTSDLVLFEPGGTTTEILVLPAPIDGPVASIDLDGEWIAVAVEDAVLLIDRSVGQVHELAVPARSVQFVDALT